jgi:hypothetical protein
MNNPDFKRIYKLAIRTYKKELTQYHRKLRMDKYYEDRVELNSKIYMDLLIIRLLEEGIEGLKKKKIKK